MYAKIILSKAPVMLDRVLDYLVPEGMELTVGDSVIVPFGAKNKPVQGFVAGLSEKSEAANVKSISEKSELGKCFDEKMLSLVKWMRERYLCTIEEAVGAVVPSGTSVKTAEWLSLTEWSDKKSYADILNIMEENGGSIEYEKLLGLVGENSAQKISKMVKEGILHREFLSGAKVKRKTVKAARLKISAEEAESFKGGLSPKNRIWADIVDILLVNDFVSVKDLALFTNSSGSAVKTLEKRGVIECFDADAWRIPKNKYNREEKKVVLTDEQKIALNSLTRALDDEEYKEFLLYGVTGSGKTEVFMGAAAHSIEMGKQVIVLVPEISLTPQTVNRFTSRFGSRIAVLHSGLSAGERFDQWRKIRSGDIDIVIGARSAIFAPLQNIGLIVVDEEHSDTYKSEMSPRYDAKEAACFRAKKEKGVLVLASATPSLEDYFRAEKGEISFLKMEKRANKGSMPQITVTDMRDELTAGNKSVISTKLREEIEKNLEAKEQTILFLNRRGFSTFVSCRECGFVAQCPNCNISLTYHKFDNTLRCHYCGHTIKNYVTCPKCHSKYIRYFGGGTQKLEEEIKTLFPTASVIRMDIDTTGKKQSHEEILKKFEKEKIDILIGTQMVTKGLDFENVTLVGVVCADTMLNIDDFRSAERTFDILEQVTGRAGRGEKPGRAVIQTYSPEHEAVLCATKHSYNDFYEGEIKLRSVLRYPPFCDIVYIGFTGPEITAVSECASDFFKSLKNCGMDRENDILGPIPSAVSKINGKYRWQILVKCDSAGRILSDLVEIKKNVCANDNYKKVSVAIVRNPVHVY